MKRNDLNVEEIEKLRAKDKAYYEKNREKILENSRLRRMDKGVRKMNPLPIRTEEEKREMHRIRNLRYSRKLKNENKNLK